MRGDLHVSSGPMTQAKARSIQQAMGSLIASHKDLKGLGEFDCVGQEAFNSVGLPKTFNLLTCHELIES